MSKGIQNWSDNLCAKNFHLNTFLKNLQASTVPIFLNMLLYLYFIGTALFAEI